MTEEQKSFERMAEWSLHRASNKTKEWLEPAIEKIREALADGYNAEEYLLTLEE